MNVEEKTKKMDEIIDFFNKKKGHTLSPCTRIGVETYPPVICWMESNQINFTLKTGNDKRHWKNFEKTLKEKFPCIKHAYLDESDGSRSSKWVVRLK